MESKQYCLEQQHLCVCVFYFSVIEILPKTDHPDFIECVLSEYLSGLMCFKFLQWKIHEKHIH